MVVQSVLCASFYVVSYEFSDGVGYVCAVEFVYECVQVYSVKGFAHV